MPISDLRRPSLALGVLHAVLKRDGISVKTIYGNLLYCEHVDQTAITLPFNSIISMLGDWVFAGSAFPDYHPDQQSFFDFFFQRSINLRRRAGLPECNQSLEKKKQTIMAIRAGVDGFLDFLANRILAGNPAVVGCSSTFQQHVASLALLRRIRERAPHVITLLGGANCEGIMGQTTHRHFDWVDYVVSGEADELISPLIRSILGRGRDLASAELPEGVFGPVHRAQGYPTTANGQPPRATIRDMTRVQTPDYDDFFETLRAHPALNAAIRPTLPYESSRGCWWHVKKGCTFCGLNGAENSYRSRPPEQVVAQVREMVARYNLRHFFLADNIMDMRYIADLLPRLSQDEVTRTCLFFYEIKSTLREDQVAALRRAGVRWVQPGIESLNSEMLRMMNKGCQAWQNIQLLKYCLRHGVRPVWHVLFGFPGEKDEWLQAEADLMPLLHHLPRPTMLTVMRIERFSAYHTHQERYGLRLVPFRDYFAIYPLPREALMDLAYFFDDASDDEFVLNPFFPFWDSNALDALRREHAAWRKCWVSKAETDRPRLLLSEAPDALIISDTRSAATAPEHRLEGLDRTVCLAAESAPRLVELISSLAPAGHTPAAITSAIEGLIERRLAIRIDGRLLGLPVREALAPFPTDKEYLGGSFDVQTFLALKSKGSGR